MVYKFFDKKISCGAVTRVRSETLATRDTFAVRNEIMSGQKLAE